MRLKSTQLLLKNIPGFPCLYCHDVNEIHYGITQMLGNRKEHSLGATDRKMRSVFQGLASGTGRNRANMRGFSKCAFHGREGLRSGRWRRNSTEPCVADEMRYQVSHNLIKGIFCHSQVSAKSVNQTSVRTCYCDDE